jgi:hypothetical protein
VKWRNQLRFVILGFFPRTTTKLKSLILICIQSTTIHFDLQLNMWHFSFRTKEVNQLFKRYHSTEIFILLFWFRPISFHIPLQRLFAAVVMTALEAKFVSFEFLHFDIIFLFSIFFRCIKIEWISVYNINLDQMNLLHWKLFWKQQRFQWTNCYNFFLNILSESMYLLPRTNLVNTFYNKIVSLVFLFTLI